MKKTKSIWVYYRPSVADAVEPRLRKKAKSMGGKEEGNGCCLGSSPERDISFGFSDPKAARKFADLVRKWKHIHRTKIVIHEE